MLNIRCWGEDTKEEIREGEDNYMYEAGRKAEKV
jgi:hypothetical protein